MSVLFTNLSPVAAPWQAHNSCLVIASEWVCMCSVHTPCAHAHAHMWVFAKLKKKCTGHCQTETVVEGSRNGVNRTTCARRSLSGQQEELARKKLGWLEVTEVTSSSRWWGMWWTWTKKLLKIYLEGGYGHWTKSKPRETVIGMFKRSMLHKLVYTSKSWNKKG